MPAGSSSALPLAARLRGLDDPALRALLTARQVRERRVQDFFDLADELLDPASLQAALAALERPTLRVLVAAAELDGRRDRLGELLHDLQDAQERLAHLEDLALLVDDDGQLLVFEEVLHQLDTWPESGLPGRRELLESAPPPVLDLVDDADPELLDRAAAERAFTTTTAVGELLAALTAHPVRELAKGGLPLPEAKRLSAAAGTDLPDVPRLLALAERAGLVSSGGVRAATAAAADWAASPTLERWMRLADCWLQGLPRPVRELLGRPGRVLWRDRLPEFLRWLYPGSQERVLQRMSDQAHTAELLGITHDGRTSGPGLALLTAGAETARSALRPLLPVEVERVYLQHDLSVVAPGPLTPSADARLRRFADVESKGLASTFRITQASLTRALAAGETAARIREALTELSLTGIPQPLDYLLVETSNRFGSLRVGRVTDPRTASRGAASYVRSDDTTLIAAIAVDTALSTLGLQQGDERTIFSRFEHDVVYWALADARYPVVPEDAEGRVVMPAPPGAPTPEVTESAEEREYARLDSLLQRLRSAGSSSEDGDESAWLVRQLEVAIRARASVRVTVRLPDSSEAAYTLEPAALAGGRLRSRDRGADIERTLPIASIVAVQVLD